MNSESDMKSKLLLYNMMTLCFIVHLAPKLISIFLVIISIISIFNFKIEKNKNINYYLPFILSISFYVINIFGLFWSSDIDSGFKHLEIKLSFLVIPIIFLNKNLISQNKIVHLFQSYLAGNCALAIYSIANAAFAYFQYGSNHFTYTFLSPNFHPTYLSIYSLFSLGLLFNTRNLIIKNKILKISVIVFLVIWLLLLSSKINILLLFVVLIFQLIITIGLTQNKPKLLAWSFLFSAFIATFLYLNTSITDRFKTSINTIISSNNISKNDTESNRARILIWKSATCLVHNNPIIGVGTGDVNNELVKEYEKRSYLGIKEKRLNAHNQYLQTALATGIPSMLFLLFFITFPILVHHSAKYRILHYFVFIFSINALVESTLENQAGVVFFIFFTLYF